MPPPMRALVTGGAGFIGSNLVDALVARGDEVTVVDDLSTGRRENLTAALDAGARLLGVSTVPLRYGNVYGPRQDPLGEAGVIAIFCGRLRARERPIVFGDGLQVRDYVYVDDVVASNLLAAEADVTGQLNIGTGVETTVLDLVEALAPHASASFEPDHQPERPGEV